MVCQRIVKIYKVESGSLIKNIPSEAQVRIRTI